MLKKYGKKTKQEREVGERGDWPQPQGGSVLSYHTGWESLLPASVSGELDCDKDWKQGDSEGFRWR